MKFKHTDYFTDQGYYFEDLVQDHYTTFFSETESIKVNLYNEPDIITLITQIEERGF